MIFLIFLFFIIFAYALINRRQIPKEDIDLYTKHICFNFFNNKNIYMAYISIVILMLFGSTIKGLPYIYFQFLRIIVCGTAIYKSILSFNDNKKIWGKIFIGMAFLFNPIIPFYFDREIWLFFDLLSALIMLASLPLL